MALSLPFSESTISARGQYGPRLWNGAQTFHTGVDFAIAGGVNIPAAESGVVTHVEYTALKGYQVQIQHGTVARTRYHMLDASIPVRAGDTVTKGQTLGKVASQRYSTSAAWTGPHLHFEVWYPFTDGSNPQYTHANPVAFIRNQAGTDPAGTTPVPIPDTEEFSLSTTQYNNIMAAVQSVKSDTSWSKEALGGSNAGDPIRTRVSKIQTILESILPTLEHNTAWTNSAIGGSNDSDSLRTRIRELQQESDAIVVYLNQIKAKLGI